MRNNAKKDLSNIEDIVQYNFKEIYLEKHCNVKDQYLFYSALLNFISVTIF